MPENASSKSADLSGLRIDDRARSAGSGRRKRRLVATAAVVILLLTVALLMTRTRTPLVAVAEARPGGDPAMATLLNAQRLHHPAPPGHDRGQDNGPGGRCLRRRGHGRRRRPAPGQARRFGRASGACRRPGPSAARRPRRSPSLRVNLANAEREWRRQEELEAGRIHQRCRPSTWRERRPTA
ncbi:MAG: hypothetical protein MZU84_08940 [Sphingobacterium sp.]|nr:hypothetical protein [Sphingobacterium sp.]